MHVTESFPSGEICTAERPDSQFEQYVLMASRTPRTVRGMWSDDTTPRTDKPACLVAHPCRAPGRGDLSSHVVRLVRVNGMWWR